MEIETLRRVTQELGIITPNYELITSDYQGESGRTSRPMVSGYPSIIFIF
jgi:hypothetical protein